MMHGSLVAALVTAALGAALVGGILFAFSTFVMPALARQPAAGGIATMQAINRTVFTPWVMVPFVGTGPALLAIAAALWSGVAPGTAMSATLVTAAAAVYVVGCLGITRGCNIPRNERLDAFQPEQADAEAYWHDYLVSWTRWNHIRTAACLATSALAIAALLV